MSSEQRFGEDPWPFYLLLGFFFLFELFRRVYWGFVPGDFTAYLSAADVFASGGNPYSDAIFEADRYNGFPYNYFPGTLYLIYPLAFIPTVVAVTVDWIIRAAVVVAALRWLQRRILPDAPLHWVLLLGLLAEPLLIDFFVGNTVSYLLGAWVASAYLAEQHPEPKRLLAAFGCGLVIAFKPFWFVPAGYCYAVHRNWRGLVALGGGGALVAGLSLIDPSVIPDYLAHTQRMREFYFSVDLLNLEPMLLPVAAGVWGWAAFVLWRDGPRRWVWLFGCASIPIWPRLATYSYVLTLPMIFFLIRRWGWKKGGLYSLVVIGPIPWLLRYAPFLPGEREENLALFTWTIVTSVILFRILRELSEGEEEADVATA